MGKSLEQPEGPRRSERVRAQTEAKRLVPKAPAPEPPSRKRNARQTHEEEESEGTGEDHGEESKAPRRSRSHATGKTSEAPTGLKATSKGKARQTREEEEEDEETGEEEEEYEAPRRSRSHATGKTFKALAGLKSTSKGKARQTHEKEEEEETGEEDEEEYEAHRRSSRSQASGSARKDTKVPSTSQPFPTFKVPQVVFGQPSQTTANRKRRATAGTLDGDSNAAGLFLKGVRLGQNVEEVIEQSMEMDTTKDTTVDEGEESDTERWRVPDLSGLCITDGNPKWQGDGELVQFSVGPGGTVYGAYQYGPARYATYDLRKIASNLQSLPPDLLAESQVQTVPSIVQGAPGRVSRYLPLHSINRYFPKPGKGTIGYVIGVAWYYPDILTKMMQKSKKVDSHRIWALSAEAWEEFSAPLMWVKVRWNIAGNPTTWEWRTDIRQYMYRNDTKRNFVAMKSVKYGDRVLIEKGDEVFKSDMVIIDFAVQFEERYDRWLSGTIGPGRVDRTPSVEPVDYKKYY